MLRHLASVKVTHDGSIKLNLVREGMSERGYQWAANGENSSQILEREAAESKTKSITIHTSGRINYHFSGGHTRYIPCLLDLDAPVPILAYSIPRAELLDEINQVRDGDWTCEIPPEYNGRMNFTFIILPAVLPSQEGELGRFGVEGLYALSWVAGGVNDVARVELPGDVFTTLRPENGLTQQSIPEEEAYLRFRRAMYANDVVGAIEELPNQNEVPAELIEAMIEEGPGLYPPNKEGVWTLLTRVPMRVAPKLAVDFEDARYRADVVELRPGDTRLSTVRVRFKVFDEQAKRYVREHVAIRGLALDAEL